MHMTTTLDTHHSASLPHHSDSPVSPHQRPPPHTHSSHHSHQDHRQHRCTPHLDSSTHGWEKRRTAPVKILSNVFAQGFALCKRLLLCIAHLHLLHYTALLTLLWLTVPLCSIAPHWEYWLPFESSCRYCASPYAEIFAYQHINWYCVALYIW